MQNWILLQFPSLLGKKPHRIICRYVQMGFRATAKHNWDKLMPLIFPIKIFYSFEVNPHFNVWIMISPPTIFSLGLRKGVKNCPPPTLLKVYLESAYRECMVDTDTIFIVGWVLGNTQSGHIICKLTLCISTMYNINSEQSPLIKQR